jgi:ArsR family transcriptional regulator
MQVSPQSINDLQGRAQPRDLKRLFALQAQFCRALANHHRLAILHVLGQQEMCVGDLAKTLEVPIHTVSQHLRVLKEEMLVSSRKDGQTVYYSITNPKFSQACALIRQGLVEQHQAISEALDVGVDAAGK